MSEVPDYVLQIEAAFDEIDAVWGNDPNDVPGWVAQEMTFAQMRLLFLLDRHGPSPISRVAEWFAIGLPAASGIVDRVEKHGLVERRHRLDDRRVVECLLTDVGRRRIDEINGFQRRKIRQLLSVLTGPEQADFARLLMTVRDRVKAQKESPPQTE